MINADMRSYNYYILGDLDAYGQPEIVKDESGQPKVQGSVKIAIYVSSQSVQDNINYLNCQYVGVTSNKDINDTYLIQYGDELLKVLYAAKQGRFKRVYLQKVK